MGLLGAAGMLGRDQPDKGYETRGGREAGRVAQLGRDGERRQVVDAAEAAQPPGASAQGLEIQQGAQVLLDGPQPRDGFIDRAQVRPVCLLQGGHRPRLRPQPGVVTFGPGSRGGKPSPMPQEKLRQPVARAEQIGADVLATAQQVAGDLLLLGRDVDRGQRADRS